MYCPYCLNSDTKVIDKRDSGTEATRRRRECLKCSKRFTTYERVENVELTVIKKDGKRENFDRNKIVNGMLKACEKRPISREDIERTVEDIVSELRNLDTIEITSKMIGELVIKKLKKLDKVAYIRFASVYKAFADVDSFEKEIHTLLRK